MCREWRGDALTAFDASFSKTLTRTKTNPLSLVGYLAPCKETPDSGIRENFGEILNLSST